MATETERTFNLAKLVMTSQRQSLSDDIINEILCLKQWLRRGTIQLGGIIFTPPVEEQGSADVAGIVNLA
jgi:hypothetical protein